ncbi:ABC transporter permease [Kribbella sp. NPDC051718]|uniref:ABC transporter permease n=1 Tax=Kribbella sp. NPDC051718 TaxID=3155168 RepID=UPI0034271910
MNSLRIFFYGGLMSYRAQFNWLNPWILVPTLMVQPLAQIFLFAYIGRAAGVGSDEFYLIGNALNFAVIPCLFAMGATISGERWTQTLELVFATPARRLPLFLGRALPVILNGWAVAMFGLVVGSLLLDVHIDPGAWPVIALVVATTSFSCSGLGLVMGAVALKTRDNATLANVLFLVLLVFCGTNVPLDSMPGWIRATSSWLPLTHGIQAARAVADGAAFSAVDNLLLSEFGLGLLYLGLGIVMLRGFEHLSRRGASLTQM